MPEENLIIQERLNRIETRLDSNDRFRHEIRTKQEAMNLEQAVIRVQLDNIREDIEKLSLHMDGVDRKVDARLSSINRALWAGFTVFLTAFLTVVGFILTQGGAS
jgi:hypothetical protein